MNKPSLPEGMRDFSPSDVQKRQYILQTLKKAFECYGFMPLETPTMEQLTTLTGKYGEEGDRLIFKVLNNGLHEQKEEKKEKLNAEWQKLLSKPYSTPIITERALRYDLTIPFARYVVMHQHELAFPFRRYQMQPVWRADRPQKGRYREFWQCDADVVGSTSLTNEAELLALYQEAFEALSIPTTIYVNNRKILAAIATLAGVPEKMTEITVILDKIDKIGIEAVSKELAQKEVPEAGIALILAIINLEGTNEEKLNALLAMDSSANALLQTGVSELKAILNYHSILTKDKPLMANIQINFSLARGLNYYTGAIMEVVCSIKNVKMGSIGGGGRYDDLTGLFGLDNMSGVGISFGIDRIYDVMEEIQLWNNHLTGGGNVLLLNFGGENEISALSALAQLRQAGIAAELYPDCIKMDKQLKYANKRSFKWVLMIGEEERLANKVKLKNFSTGEQQILTLEESIAYLQNQL